MPNSFLDHKSHKKLIGVWSTHSGSIISFSHASSELSFTTDVKVLARILAKAGLDLAGTKRRVGQRSSKTSSRDGRLWLVVEVSDKLVGGSTTSGVFALNLQRRQCEIVLELDTS